MLPQGSLGKWGEEYAVAYLRKKKYKILAQNYFTKFGEIDIIAQKGKKLVFVEVKTRASQLFGAPEEAVDYYKQQKIIRSSQKYLQEKKWEKDYQIDVIAIQKGPKKVFLKHIKNAVVDY